MEGEQCLTLLVILFRVSQGEVDRWTTTARRVWVVHGQTFLNVSTEDVSAVCTGGNTWPSASDFVISWALSIHVRAENKMGN